MLFNLTAAKARPEAASRLAASSGSTARTRRHSTAWPCSRAPAATCGGSRALPRRIALRARAARARGRRRAGCTAAWRRLAFRSERVEAVAMQLAAVRLSRKASSMRALLAERLSDAGLPGAEAAWRATLAAPRMTARTIHWARCCRRCPAVARGGRFVRGGDALESRRQRSATIWARSASGQENGKRRSLFTGGAAAAPCGAQRVRVACQPFAVQPSAQLRAVAVRLRPATRRRTRASHSCTRRRRSGSRRRRRHPSCVPRLRRHARLPPRPRKAHHRRRGAYGCRRRRRRCGALLRRGACGRARAIRCGGAQPGGAASASDTTARAAARALPAASPPPPPPPLPGRRPSARRRRRLGRAPRRSSSLSGTRWWTGGGRGGGGCTRGGTACAAPSDASGRVGDGVADARYALTGGGSTRRLTFRSSTGARRTCARCTRFLSACRSPSTTTRGTPPRGLSSRAKTATCLLHAGRVLPPPCGRGARVAAHADCDLLCQPRLVRVARRAAAAAPALRTPARRRPCRRSAGPLPELAPARGARRGRNHGRREGTAAALRRHAVVQ